MNDTAPFSWPEGRAVAVSLSFDDARPSQIDTLLPLLNKYGVKATFYVTPQNLPPRISEWRELVAAGHEVGNHTVSHPCSINFKFCRANGLEEYSLDRMESEILDCNRQIETLLGVTPQTFAYPCGQTFVGRGTATRSYVPLIARHFIAGRGFMGEWHNAPDVCDLAQLSGRDLDQKSFAVLREWIDTAREENGWLVLAGHDAGEEDVRQVTRLDTLRALFDYVRNPANGVWLDTVAAIARYVRDRQPFAKGNGEDEH